MRNLGVIWRHLDANLEEYEDYLEASCGFQETPWVPKGQPGCLKANLGCLKANLGRLKANLGLLKANLWRLKAYLGRLKANLGCLTGGQVETSHPFLHEKHRSCAPILMKF